MDKKYIKICWNSDMTNRSPDSRPLHPQTSELNAKHVSKNKTIKRVLREKYLGFSNEIHGNPSYTTAITVWQLKGLLNNLAPVEGPGSHKVGAVKQKHGTDTADNYGWPFEKIESGL